jgi:hypothetical protein
VEPAAQGARDSRLAVSLHAALARLAGAHFVEQLLQPFREGAFRCERLAQPFTDAVCHRAAGPRVQFNIVHGDASRHDKVPSNFVHVYTVKLLGDDWLRSAFDVVVNCGKF